MATLRQMRYGDGEFVLITEAKTALEARCHAERLVREVCASPLELGNRLVMLHQGRVILEVQGEEKRRLAVGDLLARFYNAQGEAYASDRALLC